MLHWAIVRSKPPHLHASERLDMHQLAWEKSNCFEFKISFRLWIIECITSTEAQEVISHAGRDPPSNWPNSGLDGALRSELRANPNHIGVRSRLNTYATNLNGEHDE